MWTTQLTNRGWEVRNSRGQLWGWYQTETEAQRTAADLNQTDIEK